MARPNQGNIKLTRNFLPLFDRERRRLKFCHERPRTYKVDGPLGWVKSVMLYEKCVNTTITVHWRSTMISSMLREECFKAGGLFGEVLSFTSIIAFKSVTVCNGRIFLVNPGLLCQADSFGAIEGICSCLFLSCLSSHSRKKK